MVGNNIRSSTGSMTITTALSTGLGNITATAKGDVAVNSGTNGSVSLTSGGAGGAVNQHQNQFQIASVSCCWCTK